MSTREYSKGTLIRVTGGNHEKIIDKFGTTTEDTASWDDEVEIVVDGFPGMIFVLSIHHLKFLV